MAIAVTAPSIGEAQSTAPPGACIADARLQRAATTAATERSSVDSEALRAIAERDGLAAPSIRRWVGRGSARAVGDEIARWLASQSLDARDCRFARGTSEGYDAVVVAPRAAEFSVDLQTDHDTTSARFTAQFARSVRGAHVVLTSPDGRSFVALLGAAHTLSTRGTWTAQLVAEADHGPIAWARRTVIVGSPRDATATVANNSEPIRDERAWLRALNRMRLAAGAGSLRTDPMLARIAAARVRARATRAQVAHTLDADDSPDAHLRREGVQSAQIAENIARAGSLDEAFARLDRSPSHRRVRMDATFDTVSIVAVHAADGWYVVELFALRPALTQ